MFAPHKYLLLIMCTITVACSESGKKLEVSMDKSQCERIIDLDDIETATLNIPWGNVILPNECPVEFTSDNFKHDTCFRLTSQLNCNVEIQYRTHNTLIDKTITCGDSNNREEHCDIYSSMTVMFITKQEFYLQSRITVEVYRKYDDVYDGPPLSSTTFIIPIVVGCIGVFIFIGLISIFICRRYRTHPRQQQQTRLNYYQGECLRSYPTEQTTPYPQQASYNAPSTTVGFGNQSQNSPVGHQGNQPPGTQHQNYPTRYQPVPTEVSGAHDYQLPPPSYEEAQHFPSPAEQTDPAACGDEQTGTETQPRSLTPSAPPPPYQSSYDKV